MQNLLYFCMYILFFTEKPCFVYSEYQNIVRYDVYSMESFVYIGTEYTCKRINLHKMDTCISLCLTFLCTVGNTEKQITELHTLTSVGETMKPNTHSRHFLPKPIKLRLSSVSFSLESHVYWETEIEECEVRAPLYAMNVE